MGCVALGDLKPGQRASLCGHLELELISDRLRDLGFVPHTSITVVRNAPLGDPIEVELRGYRVCLRREQLGGLCVTLDRKDA